MTVDQTGVVDAIGVDKLSEELILTIIDHLAWWEDEHLPMLQEKLNTYLSFIEGGELLQTYPDAKGRAVVIDLVCKFEPDGRAKEFLDVAKSIIDDAGYVFRYGLIPQA